MTLFTYYIENRKIKIYMYYCTFCQEIGIRCTYIFDMEHIIHATNLVNNLYIPYIALHITCIYAWHTYYWYVLPPVLACVFVQLPVVWGR